MNCAAMAFSGPSCSVGMTRRAGRWKCSRRFTTSGGTDRRRQGYRPPAARRPRLALVTPLPPDPSPLAVRSATLLTRLSRDYDVTCIVHQERVDLPVPLSGLPIRSAEWLAGNGTRFDRIAYVVGDHAACHTWMPDL